jgi:hypothetical protein
MKQLTQIQQNKIAYDKANRSTIKVAIKIKNKIKTLSMLYDISQAEVIRRALDAYEMHINMLTKMVVDN